MTTTAKPDRIYALLSEAMAGAEKVYRRIFPNRGGSFELIDTQLSAMLSVLRTELEGTTQLMRQRAAIATFVRKWEKACTDDLKRT